MRRCLILLSLAVVGCGDHVENAMSAGASASATPIPWSSAAPRSWPVPTIVPEPMPKQVPACRAPDVLVEVLMGQGAGGWWTGGLRLTGRGRSCLVWGYVALRFIDATGNEVARSIPARTTAQQDWAMLGDARVFWWISNWCARDVGVAAIEAVLQADSAPIVVRVDPAMTIGARCDAPDSPYTFSVAPIQSVPMALPTLTAPPVTALAARIDAPPSVTAGARLRYIVTLTNTSTSAISLDPCPSYLETLGGHPLPADPPPPNIGSKPWVPMPRYAGVRKASYQLNCAVSAIRPLGTLAFEMVLDVPDDAVGLDMLSWAFLGGVPSARAPITIVPR